MEQVATILMLSSAAIILALGVAHLTITFFGSKLLPRDATLQDRMKLVSPVITSEISMWQAWMGFNASHSFGAMLFGLIYGYLGLWHPDFLFGSGFLLCVGLSLLTGYTLLGWNYWFSVPFRSIVVALGLYCGALVVALI